MEGPRACRPDDFAETLDLLNSIFRAGMDQTLQTDYPLVFSHAGLSNMRIIAADGRVVSHSAVAPRQVLAGGDALRIGIIAPTATHPDYRHRGYGRACIEDCIRTMENLDCALSVLWTAEATFPFYHHCGYEAVASQGWAYYLDADTLGQFSAGAFEIVRYDPAGGRHLDAIMPMHEREPYRVARSREDYAALLALPKVSTYLAKRGREILGYLVYGQGVNKPGIIEGGGEQDALHSLARHLLRGHAAESPIQALVPLTSNPLGQLLEETVAAARRPIEDARGVGYQMVRINSLRALLEGMRHHLGERTRDLEADLSLVCGDSGEIVTLKMRRGVIDLSEEESQNQVSLSRRDLSRLIFGPHRGTPAVVVGDAAGGILSRVFPYSFAIPELDHC